jgi:hypothetical protein
MGQARIQFPPLLAGVIGRNAHDYEGQEQKQRNGLPRPMFCTGLGIIPIFALIWLGHFKSLSFERRARRLRRIKYPIDGVSVKLRHQRGALYTVPFGLLGAVQNQSRDWTIDKLTVGITYDSDIDRARKLMNPEELSCGLSFSGEIDMPGYESALVPERRYALRTIQQRLHQTMFRATGAGCLRPSLRFVRASGTPPDRRIYHAGCG